MIYVVSVIGTMKNGDTKTAAVSIKDRVFSDSDIRTLENRDLAQIEPYAEQLVNVKVQVEIKRNRYARPFKYVIDVENTGMRAERIEAITSAFMVVDYECIMGNFK